MSAGASPSGSIKRATAWLRTAVSLEYVCLSGERDVGAPSPPRAQSASRLVDDRPQRVKKLGSMAAQTCERHPWILKIAKMAGPTRGGLVPKDEEWVSCPEFVHHPGEGLPSDLGRLRRNIQQE